LRLQAAFSDGFEHKAQAALKKEDAIAWVKSMLKTVSQSPVTWRPLLPSDKIPAAIQRQHERMIAEGKAIDSKVDATLRSASVSEGKEVAKLRAALTLEEADNATTERVLVSADDKTRVYVAKLRIDTLPRFVAANLTQADLDALSPDLVEAVRAADSGKPGGK
jgi:hypothetical protein